MRRLDYSKLATVAALFLVMPSLVSGQQVSGAPVTSAQQAASLAGSVGSGVGQHGLIERVG
jgi:hypothetical protein